MPESFLSAAFTGGVLAPGFYGRSDLEKYDLGLRVGHNWWVDYRGGIATRPPLKHVDYLINHDDILRFFAFKFNRKLGNNYLLIFSDQLVSFMQDGEYITEATKTVSSITAGSSTIINSTAHGYDNGTWVKLSDSALPFSTGIVAATSANSFELTDANGNSIDTTGLTFSTGTTVAKIYTIVSPYSAADLPSLVFDQYRDEVYITTNDYPRKKLIRTADTDWSFENVSGVDLLSGPTITEVNEIPLGGGGLAGVIYAVTAIDKDDQEGPIGMIFLKENAPFMPTVDSSLKIDWEPIDEAVRYNIYRSIQSVRGEATTKGEQLGYIGESIGTSFTDTNIVPDFTKSPPLIDDPFANGAVLAVTIDNDGSDYDRNDTVISIDTGTGFVGIPIVNSTSVFLPSQDAQIIGVHIINPGSGYTGGTVTFSDGASGSGATATLVLSPASGNNPACTTRAQQRRIYGGTVNLPMNIFGSSTRDQDDFNYSYLDDATDPYEFAVDSSELTPIRHLQEASLGVLVYTASNVVLVRGANDSVITSSSAISTPITQEGIDNLFPLAVQDNYLYVVDGGTAVNAIQPSNLQNYYTTKDRSLFSNHYFKARNKVIDWAHAKVPNRLVWAIREDGSFLAFSFVPEENVYAWTDCATTGRAKAAAAVHENGEDTVYFAVERTINGQTYKVLESLADTAVVNKEDVHALDHYWIRPLTAGSGTITPSGVSGDITIISNSSVWVAGDVGKVIRVAGGRGTITGFTSSSIVDVTLDLPILTYKPGTENEPDTYSTWTYDAPITEVTNLWHLEGETVTIIGDGDEQQSQTVTNGQITLDVAASHIVVGLPFFAVAGTLPLNTAEAVVEDKDKSIKEVSVRMENTRGLQVSFSETATYFDFIDHYWKATPETIFTGIREVNIDSPWEEDAAVYLKKGGPYRCRVQGFVINADIGNG